MYLPAQGSKPTSGPLPESPANSAETTAFAEPPRISVIVPTRHEAESIGHLHQQVTEALAGRSWELLFVDDSDDETVQKLEGLAAADERVRFVHRPPGERHGGLGGAVLDGFAATTSDCLVVMDADLQHTPAVLPQMIDALESGMTDVVVATRYRGAGSAAGLGGPFRTLASRGCRLLVHTLLPRTRASTDPLGGFFALRRRVVSEVALRPNGYKILLEILTRGRWATVEEVAYAFQPRMVGASKASVAEARRFLVHVWRLRSAATTAHHETFPVTPGGAVNMDRSRLRIMLFTSEVAPVVSGIATSMGNLSRGLANLGHEVDVVSRADFPRFVRRELRLSAFALAWPAFHKRLPHYDVVNVHGPVPTMSEAFLLLASTMRRENRPAIVYTHHSDVAIPGLSWACSVYNGLHGRTAQLADAILVSTAEYRDKLRSVPGTPVEIIPWGIDSRHVVARPPRPVDHLRVLFVGQLRRYKGARVLLDAVEDLPGVSVTFVGDGPERPLLENQVRSAGMANVSFRGRVSNEDLWRIYSENDVIVLPSLTTAEAYGLVLGEGMAAGCVPMASDLPGVREVAGPSGLLVPPGDAEALRDALKRLATDDVLLERLVEKCRARAHEMSVKSTTERHEDVFRRVVEHVTSRRALSTVTRSWSDPWQLLDEMVHRIGVRRVSLSMLEPGNASTGVRVFRPGRVVAEVDDAPVARYVAALRRSVLIGPHGTPDPDLSRLLRRPELTSSILVPLSRNRRSVSVVGLSTSVEDELLLRPEHQRQALRLLRARGGTLIGRPVRIRQQ